MQPRETSRCVGRQLASPAAHHRSAEPPPGWARGRCGATSAAFESRTFRQRAGGNPSVDSGARSITARPLQ